MLYRSLYLILLILFLLIFTYSILHGNVSLSKADLFNILTWKFHLIDSTTKSILMDIRLPRIVMALLIGMMLTSSGVVTQTVFQNPLADPYIIGIAASATFGVVIAYLFKLPQNVYGIFAFIVCTLVSLIIFRLARNHIRVQIFKLLMIGIAISAFLGAFTSLAIYLIGEDSFQIIIWTMGYLGYANWTHIIILLPPFIFATTYFYLKRYELDLLLSGDQEAHALGINVNKFKRRILIISSLVVGFSVAFTGMIGFIGLIIPHCLRLLIGSTNARLIPLATLFGGVFLLFCDTISRLIVAPVEIPIGVVTAFFGAPFFLYLATKTQT
ncbi:Iron ABC transporter permease [Candidatus Hepatincolaceae symbiont of Richtersius coronifer]